MACLKFHPETSDNKNPVHPVNPVREKSVSAVQLLLIAKYTNKRPRSAMNSALNQLSPAPQGSSICPRPLAAFDKIEISVNSVVEHLSAFRPLPWAVTPASAFVCVSLWLTHNLCALCGETP